VYVLTVELARCTCCGEASESDYWALMSSARVLHATAGASSLLLADHGAIACLSLCRAAWWRSLIRARTPLLAPNDVEHDGGELCRRPSGDRVVDGAVTIQRPPRG
jgi:hypothetical protein